MRGAKLVQQLMGVGKQGLGRLCRWGTVGFLGLGASWAIADGASAAERITLIYKGEELSITTSELTNFAETVQPSPELQNFLDSSGASLEFVSNLLTEQISINPSLIDDVLESSVGEFLLLKLDQQINQASASTQRDVNQIVTAVRESYEDNNAISIIEILREYPQDDIRVDLTPLEPVYLDVKNFVERILPALEIAKDFISDIVCDCPEPTTSNLDEGEAAAAKAAYENCQKEAALKAQEAQ